MEPERSIIRKQRWIRAGDRYLSLGRPLIMGILNVTPDSFYDGGMYQTPDMIRIRAGRMLEEGADILDIGACSTRPGSDPVSEADEWERLSPALNVVRTEYPDAVISVDTYRSGIALRAVEEYGVEMINDISGGQADPAMFPTIGKLPVSYILMHMQGTPASMQEHPRYDDVVADISQFFAAHIRDLVKNGAADIVIDPGFGFGKSLDHNYELLNRLEDFRIFERPILVGFSRKSMIFKVLEGAPQASLNGTTVLNAAALLKRADILRVHDVRQARECVILAERINRRSDEFHI